MTARALTVLLLLPVLGAGCWGTDDGPPDDEEPWHGRDLDARDPTWQNHGLGPGWGLEIDFGMRPGDVLEWDWFVEQRVAVDFDLHRHENARVVYIEQIQAVEHTGAHEAQRADLYSLMWCNVQEQDVVLWFRVPDGGRHYEIHPMHGVC